VLIVKLIIDFVLFLQRGEGNKRGEVATFNLEETGGCWF